MKNERNKMKKDYLNPTYTQFKDKPVEAIKHLRRVKKGQAVNVMYVDKIGEYIDFIWGENNPKTNRGFGLKHAIEKHEKDIKKMGFTIEQIIPFVLKVGQMELSKIDYDKYYFTSKYFRVVIKTKFNGKKKNFLLTAFDIKKFRYGK